jgi:hypothetical protein
MVFPDFVDYWKISLISHRISLWKNKERDFTPWNFVPIAVHALNQKEQAKATPLSYAAQNVVSQSSQ